MRRSYEYKEESYIVHERGSWDYPSYYEKYHEAPTPNIHTILHKPTFEYSNSSSYGQHDHVDGTVLNKTHWDGAHECQASRGKYVDRRDEGDMAFGGSRWDKSHNWSGTHNMGSFGDTLCGSQWAKGRNWGGTDQINNENSAMKKIDQQAFRSNYGHHGEDETTVAGLRWVEGRSWGGAHRHTTNDDWMEASEGYEGYNHSSNNNNHGKKATKQIEDYDARLQGGVESLIKGLYGSGLGRKVHKFEVIEYERSTRFGGGITTYHL